ncbi:high-affinity nicotinic acid transporter [Fusarium subglutinans]|uniref:High-affinity nicotinic acid transporter n=1 Tax=Gibberella subglutinans TaxID=42677 RepID=A0A8H5QAY2_GIBSU|nr:high-affinity nicotinic acid transporter [Fusarium subglutinans]KAF5611937.1 high-affinity nicotinic acid transporter [Fusarium subglutinans]
MSDKGSVHIADKTDNAKVSLAEGAGFTEADTKRLIRKIDWSIIPFVSLLYLLSFLDRTNIGNARLDTLELDLNMSGLMYNHALAIFFPFYIIAEIPSNMGMKRFRPWIWIPSMMVVWGICCTLMGIVHNYAGLLAARSFLGLAEGGLFPGIAYYITMWYRRHECGFRMAIFFSAATAAGVFGGFLARGIMEMRGLAGLAGWQWIFIIEGLLTVAVALASFKLMADYPDRAKFITNVERKHIQERLMLDRSGLAEEFEMKYVWDAFKDWKIWVHMLIATGTFTGVYSYSLFLPTIIRDLGYSSTTAQLMSTPPYLVACIVCVGAGWWADKIQQRGIFMIVFITMAGLGLILLMAVRHSGVRYFGCFLLASGIFPSVPQGIAWNSNNIGGSLKRGVGIAMNVSCGNLGGIIASYLFLKKDAPRYFPGFGTLLGCQVMALILSIWMAIYLRRENARRDGTHKDPSLYTEDEKQAEREKGDNATFFRGDSLVVTDPTTNPPVSGLTKGERTGSRVLHYLWSFQYISYACADAGEYEEMADSGFIFMDRACTTGDSMANLQSYL